MFEPDKVVNIVEGEVNGDVTQVGDVVDVVDVGNVANVVRGTVNGSVLQVGTVHGDVNFTTHERKDRDD
jgi:hypothetical protein